MIPPLAFVVAGTVLAISGVAALQDHFLWLVVGLGGSLLAAAVGLLGLHLEAWRRAPRRATLSAAPAVLAAAGGVLWLTNIPLGRAPWEVPGISAESWSVVWIVIWLSFAASMVLAGVAVLGSTPGRRTAGVLLLAGGLGSLVLLAASFSAGCRSRTGRG